jgi:hypothetical protein
MSNSSAADSSSTTLKKAKKADVGAKPGTIASPPHFGDIGKAANDTFSKVTDLSSLLHLLVSIERILTIILDRTFLFQVCIY